MSQSPSVTAPPVSTTSQTKVVDYVPISVLPSPFWALLGAGDCMGDRRSLTSQLLHGSTGIAQAGPQLVLDLQDPGQRHLTPGGGEQEVGFQNHLYAEDFHIFLSSPNLSPELQTHEGSLVIATWHHKYDFLSTEIIISSHTTHPVVQGRNLRAILDSSLFLTPYLLSPHSDYPSPYHPYHDLVPQDCQSLPKLLCLPPALPHLVHSPGCSQSDLSNRQMGSCVFYLKPFSGFPLSSGSNQVPCDGLKGPLPQASPLPTQPPACPHQPH